MLMPRPALRFILLVPCLVNALQCSTRTLADQCGYAESIGYAFVDSVLQYSTVQFAALTNGRIEYTGNSAVIELDPDSGRIYNAPLYVVLSQDGAEYQDCRYVVVMSSDKTIAVTRVKMDGSNVEKVGRFTSLLVSATIQDADKGYALVTLTWFEDNWRAEKDAIRFYDHPPTPQDVDTFLLEHDTPDYQLIPRSSIPGAPNAELYDSHIEFHSIRICQDACEDAFGGVPSSLAKHL